LRVTTRPVDYACWACVHEWYTVHHRQCADDGGM